MFFPFPFRVRSSDSARMIQLFETEINSKVKREPALVVGSRSKVFSDGEVKEVVAGEEEGLLVGATRWDFVGELWAF